VAAWLSGSALVSINKVTPGPVSTGMEDRLRLGKPSRFVTSHSGQLSLLPSVGWKMSTGQSDVKLGWGNVCNFMEIQGRSWKGMISGQ